MDPLRLIPDDDGEVIILTTDLVVVGRDAGCGIRLGDASVSRQHAEIRLEGDRWLVRDLNSANGIMLDGKRIPHGSLRHGQRLQFGSVGFRLEMNEGGDSDGATLAFASPAPWAAVRESGEPIARPAPTESARVSGQAAPPSHRRAWMVVAASVAVLAIGFGVWLRAQSASRPSPAGSRTTPTVAPAASPSASPVANPVSAVEAVATSTPQPAPSGSPGPTPGSPAAADGPPALAEAAMPSPAPVATVALPRGVIVISTDTQAAILVNGQAEGLLQAGGFRRVEVTPGEHIVTFEVGRQRRDIVVRTNANEQAVARFEMQSLRPATPVPTPTLAPRRSASDERPSRAAAPKPQGKPPLAEATPPVTPAVTPVPAAPAPAAPPVRSSIPPSVADAGLAKGVAATTRADYYRALLLLNDAVRRLEKDPQGGADLVIAHAYLAWTHHGLGRADEAQGSARQAMRLDPGVLAKLGSFPAPVLALFKASR